MAKNPHAYLAKQRDKQIESTFRSKKAYKNENYFSLTLPDGSITLPDGTITSWTMPIEKHQTTKKIKTAKRGWVKPGFDIDNFKKFYKYNKDV